LARTHHTASELAVRHRQAVLVSGGKTSITRDASFIDRTMQSIAVFDWVTHTQPAMYENFISLCPLETSRFMLNFVTQKFSKK